MDSSQSLSLSLYMFVANYANEQELEKTPWTTQDELYWAILLGCLSYSTTDSAVLNQEGERFRVMWLREV